MLRGMVLLVVEKGVLLVVKGGVLQVVEQGGDS